MIYYEHDLYPREDPRDGARLVRFSHLQLAEYLDQRNGTGSGKIALRSTSPDAAFIDSDGLDYVRVRRVNTAVVDGGTPSGFGEAVVGGYFLEADEHLALDRHTKRLLTLNGAGTLSYLDREQMWSHTYETWGKDPSEGDQPDTWNLFAQSTIFAGGDYLGAILWRIVHEGLGYRGAPGYAATPTFADDKTESAIPFVVLTFDGFEDTDGNPWTVPSGEFTAQVGESLLAVTKRLMEAGLYVEMDPDTFELRAWEVANHGRDRTGGAWASDVIRFVPPPDEDRTKGNILNDLKRSQVAKIGRTQMLAGGQDIYGTAVAAGDVPWHGFYGADVSDTAALDAIAVRQLAARNDAGDMVQVRIKCANDPANGYYLPGEHILVDDAVTLHNGTGEWDWNEATYPVAAWSVKTRRSGAPDVFVHLGSTYSVSDRQFQVGGGGSPCPCIRLCANAQEFIETGGDWKVLNIFGGSEPAGWKEVGFDTAAWTDGAEFTSPHTGLQAVAHPADPSRPNDVVLARMEYVVAEADLSGAAVVFKYAFDNFGTLWVNGVQIAQLGLPEADSHWNTDHATTLARSNFVAGVNVVAIRFENEADGSLGGTPPGTCDAEVYIELPVNGSAIMGHEHRGAHCDHFHRHNDLLGRFGVDQHDASGINYDNATSGLTADDVQELGDELVALIAAGGGGAARVHDLVALHRFLIVANRGYNLNDDGAAGTSMPEDTLEGFRLAAEAGCDFVEIDVQQNADGTWVAMHDLTVTRTTSSTGNVNAKTDAAWAALAIDGGFGYNATRHAGLFTAPFLDDILDALEPYGCLAMLEIKGGDELELVQHLMDIGWVERTIINGGFSDPTAMKALNPNITLQHGGGGTGAVYDSSSNPYSDVVDLAFTQAFAPLWVHAYVPIAEHGLDETTIRQDMYDRGVRSWETYDVTGSIAFRDGLASAAETDPVALAALTAHLADAADAHDASAVSAADAAGHFTATEVEGQLQELGAAVDALEVAVDALEAVSALGLLTVDAGTPTYDDSGADVVISLASKWGYDADGPYFNSAGVTAGEEAILALDPEVGDFVVIPYNP